MDLHEQLRLWGMAHAQARAAEHAARQHGGAAGELRREAAALRERADRLHGEIYRSLGQRPGAARDKAR